MQGLYDYQSWLWKDISFGGLEFPWLYVVEVLSFIHVFEFQTAYIQCSSIWKNYVGHEPRFQICMKEIPTSSHPNIIRLSSNGIVVRLLSFADIHWQHTFPVAIMFQIFFKIILISVQLLWGSFSFGQEWFECQQQCKSFNNIQHKEHQMRACRWMFNSESFK
jgi:hypothetical protein